MKTVTPTQLREAHESLYPNQRFLDGQPWERWLWIYNQNPIAAIALQGPFSEWTKALFKALGIKQPKTKRQMLAALAE